MASKRRPASPAPRRKPAAPAHELSPEDLKNAAPDPAALAKAQSYRSDKPTAERFAREGKLADVKVDYQDGGRK